MAFIATVGFRDVNGATSRTSFGVANEVNAISVIQSLSDLSNAQIVSAYYTEVIDLAFLAANNAVAANIETVKSKLRVLYQGEDLDPTAVERFPTVQLYIPAPVGTVYDGTAASLQGNANLQAFLGAGRLMTPFGIDMTTLLGGGYSSR
jgi:hypothetical protein